MAAGDRDRRRSPPALRSAGGVHRGGPDGGTLVVDVLGPAAGTAEAQPEAEMSGPAVATLTIPCNGREASADLSGLPASSGPLAVNAATRQVEHGWVVLSRTT